MALARMSLNSLIFFNYQIFSSVSYKKTYENILKEFSAFSINVINCKQLHVTLLIGNTGSLLLKKAFQLKKFCKSVGDDDVSHIQKAA